MLTLPILACLWAVTALAADSPDELEPEIADQTFLLQQRQSIVREHGAREHYWPHARGHSGKQSQTPYVSMPHDLNSSLMWRWDSPDPNAAPLWGSLIDYNKNIYACSERGIMKFSPVGQVLWVSDMSTEMPSLVGDTLVGMRMLDCLAFALDLETGNKLWENQLCTHNGMHGDFVEVHNGVAVVGADAVQTAIPTSGLPSTHVKGMDIRDGRLLWKFKVDCGIWNILALFPDDETTIFMDYCGGLYRVGLRNGTEIWRSKGEYVSFTDGGAVMGADGNVYTCSNPTKQNGSGPKAHGLLRKYRPSDGARLWSADLPYPCVNFPGLSMDGQTVVVAPGALALEPKTKEAFALPEHLRADFYHKQLELVKLNQQRSYYGYPNIGAAIMGLDTATGAVQWRHDVKPYGGIAFAYDEERAWRYFNNQAKIPYCWPSHWTAPISDRNGVVYIARSTGDFYAYDPKADKELTYHTGDGAMIGGMASAPELMLVTTCSSIFAFQMPP